VQSGGWTTTTPGTRFSDPSLVLGLLVSRGKDNEPDCNCDGSNQGERTYQRLSSTNVLVRSFFGHQLGCFILFRWIGGASR
jgi:hypothetical protein